MPRRKPLNETADYIRLHKAFEYIMSNEAQFYRGESFLVSQLARSFGVPQPVPSNNIVTNIKRVNKYILSMSSIQVAFNRLLIQRGLYMRKNNNHYVILHKPQTKKKVRSLRKHAKQKAYTSRTLSAGLSNFPNGLQDSSLTVNEVLTAVKAMRGE